MVLINLVLLLFELILAQSAIPTNIHHIKLLNRTPVRRLSSNVVSYKPPNLQTHILSISSKQKSLKSDLLAPLVTEKIRIGIQTQFEEEITIREKSMFWPIHQYESLKTSKFYEGLSDNLKKIFSWRIHIERAFRHVLIAMSIK